MSLPANNLGRLPSPISPHRPVTALAPMQDVTDHAFFHLSALYGPPDYFFTEFLRVHSQSRPEKHIVYSIDHNKTGRPIFAQLIGEDLEHLERTVKALLQHNIAGIDLNMGCPAPKVYKKNVGGGLLRDPAKIRDILKTLRACCPGLFTVKMRIGFEDDKNFETILDLINEFNVDLLSLHGRTVKEMYRSEVHYEYIKRAVEKLHCPVLANGNITSAEKAVSVLAYTGAAGVMIGRHAIRNPWIFHQCHELLAGNPVSAITLGMVRQYVEDLYKATQHPGIIERAHVNKMKKYLNFVGQSVDAEGRFLRSMRICQTEKQLFHVCDEHLAAHESELFALEPYPGVIARPNCETADEPQGCQLSA